MPGDFKHSSGNKAVAWLATCVVIAGGAFVCFAIAMVSDAQRSQGLTICGSAFAGILLLLWIMRERPSRQAKLQWAWLSRRKKRKVAFKVKPRVGKSALVPPPVPPSAESVRNLSGGISTWVPSQAPPQRKPRNSRNK